MRSSLSAIGHATKEQFLKVLVPLLVVNSKLSVLFTKRSIHLKQHRGEVCFPGGKMESKETAEETALRESHEEIGLDPKSVEIWGQLKPVLTRSLIQTVVPVVGCINEDSLNSKLINTNEVQTLFSASLDELCQTAGYTHFSTRMVDFKLPVFFTRKFTVHSHNEAEFLHNEFRIWGLSAVMLHQLLSIMVPEKYNSALKLKFY